MSILLKSPIFKHIDNKSLATQIQAKKKAEKKLPTWFNTNNIYYPSPISIEQTSSEITAKYKATLIDGKSLIDVSGGFGVDSFYFSKKIESVIHSEINESLSKIVSHNYKQLGANSIKTNAGDGIDYIAKQGPDTFDWIYVDPSRRHDQKGKVFFLKDCLPNVPKHLEMLFKKGKNILLKTAPLLDITAGLKELSNVKEIHIVAVKNEVKELLWILERGYDDNTIIYTINLDSQHPPFQFNFPDISIDTITLASPKQYLYEPNSAILKAGGFNSTAKQFGLEKLHQHSHLYTSNSLFEFPGRVFKVLEQLAYDKKILLEMLKGKTANITTRNFPESVEQLRKKFKIKDGGDLYIFFTTNFEDKKIVLFCSKS
jgi:16S rRNA G966 N2-methylase RsmD